MADFALSDSDDTFDGFNSDDVADPYAFEGFTSEDADSDSDNERDSAAATTDQSDHTEESDIDDDLVVSDSDLSEDCESEEEEEDFIVKPPVWTDTFVPSHVPFFQGPTGPVYPNSFDCRTASPLEYLQLFLTDDFLELVLQNSNEYARKRRREKGHPEEQYWKEPLTMPELKAFLGICILFGVSPLPAYNLYWSKSPLFGNEGVKKVMTKRRYEKINEYFHVSDPNSEPDRAAPDADKLFKVRPVLDLCEKLFPKHFLPREFHTIDEALIACKSRVQFLQYMPDKPKKRGVKVFLRCDSKTGYMYQFEVYLGKRGPKPGPHGIYYDIVSRLSRPIRGANMKVITDNLYTGIPILQMLQGQRVFGCGTLRPNRKFLHPDIATASKTGKSRGWFKTLQDKNNPLMTISAWNDTKMVRYCSTMSKPDVPSECMRRCGALYLRVKRPHVSEHYAEHMGGVDICDQSRAKYRCV